MAKGTLIAAMKIGRAAADEFHDWYDTEHIPNLLKVPGVRAVTRMAGEHFALSIGGAEKKVAHDGPRYSAVYEIDGPHVLVSSAWANAVEEGRWPGQFNADFLSLLALSALWTGWRNGWSPSGWALAVLAFLLGGGFAMAYILVLLHRERGDMGRVLMGVNAPPRG